MQGLRALLLLFVMGLGLALWTGCALPGRKSAHAIPVSNPLVIPTHNEDVAWEQIVDVLHEYHFEIERENRQARTIETKYRVGSGVLEPWHGDSVGWRNRVESTLQSIRRKVIVTLSPCPQGYAVQVVALKELEDLDAIAANSPGGATFQESTPLERDLSQVVGQSRPSGWIPQGRDLDLERGVLAQLDKAGHKSRKPSK